MHVLPGHEELPRGHLSVMVMLGLDVVNLAELETELNAKFVALFVRHVSGYIQDECISQNIAWWFPEIFYTRKNRVQS